MIHPPRRVHFSAGRLLSAEDLAAEQTYHREMRYLHNRLHGYGTVSGLDVDVLGDDVQVGAGLAIDPLGRELVLTEPATIPIASLRTCDCADHDLVLIWDEVYEDPVPTPDGPVSATRVVERPRVLLVPPEDAPGEAVVLARLSRTRRGVAVDTSVRRRWPDKPCR